MANTADPHFFTPSSPLEAPERDPLNDVLDDAFANPKAGKAAARKQEQSPYQVPPLEEPEMAGSLDALFSETYEGDALGVATTVLETIYDHQSDRHDAKTSTLAKTSRKSFRLLKILYLVGVIALGLVVATYMDELEVLTPDLLCSFGLCMDTLNF